MALRKSLALTTVFGTTFEVLYRYHSENPPIPQWLLSKIKPIDIIKRFDLPPEKKGFISKYFKL
jgi:hypothetical protein